MPRRNDLETILLIGSGPIVIGQACEFDYSGTQACRVLREEGYRVVLVNSNPATIMTDPEFADATYVEPLDVPTLRTRSSRSNAPTRCCPTLGGQTGAQPRDRAARGGRARRVRRRADRRAHRSDPHRRGPPAVQGRDDEIGLRFPPSGTAYTLDEAIDGRASRRLPADRAARRTSSAAAAPASRTTPSEFAARRRARPRREPDLGDPDRAQSSSGGRSTSSR